MHPLTNRRLRRAKRQDKFAQASYLLADHLLRKGTRAIRLMEAARRPLNFNNLKG